MVTTSALSEQLMRAVEKLQSDEEGKQNYKLAVMLVIAMLLPEMVMVVAMELVVTLVVVLMVVPVAH